MTIQMQTVLNHRIIDYSLKRSRRKSIGLIVDRQGLRINAPLYVLPAQIDAILQQKADWITNKLEQWQQKQDLPLPWTRDAIYPLLGEPWRIALKSTGEIDMARQSIHETPQLSAIELTPRQIETFVMAWYHQQAIICFKQRIDSYAQKLNLPPPPFRLSQAKTRWGSCSSRGFISLNWCLIQLPLHLIDYVVAHELSHLIEMNHSKAFWIVVGSVYPGYRAARRELKQASRKLSAPSLQH